MHIDPHIIQLILVKVREQLRCPQCTRRLEVQFDAFKIMSEQFAVLQVQCATCGAHIMLHATMDRATEEASIQLKPAGRGSNASTELSLSEKEMEELREAIKVAGGSFTRLFESGDEGSHL